MQRFTTSFFGFLLLAGTSAVIAQAPKYPLFEHFTQASCGPCAQQNPGFQTSILEQNLNTVRHIAYHTSWPGVDPMYNYNTAESNARVDYYNVTGVPEIILMGNVKVGQPGDFSQVDVDNQVAATSPIKITVTDVDNGTSHDLTVTVVSVGEPPTGNLKLRTAIIERDVNYATPPGNNGETYFPNVFRDMIPGTDGELITLATQGDSVSFTYTYDEDAIWNMDEIGVVSFVQDDVTKEIFNAGSSFAAPSIAISDSTIVTQSVIAGTTASFSLHGLNVGNSTQDYTFSVTSDAPADWMAEFKVEGSTYTSSATISVEGGATMPVRMDVTPGATPALATYTLTIQSLTNLNEDPVEKSVYVFSAITELVVNNSVMDPTTASFLESTYTAALTEAGSSTYAFINSGLAERAASENSLVDVNNIYYNAGWYFPAFTDDLVSELMNFMDGGGNLFISGQDIGWDIWTDPADLGHATELSQDFYNNYMFADYIGDGDNANNPLTANPDDAIFGDLGSITINEYYGSTYFYPDQIEPKGVGIPIFYYNSNTSSVGAVRGENGVYKTVYIAPGIEMLGTEPDKTAIIKTAYDWFYGFTGTEPVIGVLNEMGQNFPNPSHDFTYIPVSGAIGNTILIITDHLGRVLFSQELKNDATLIEVNTSRLASGVYFYRLDSGFDHGTIKLMEVLH